MQKKNKFLLILVLVFTSYSNMAYAYLDPGTGSIILQAILGFLAASVAAISVYWIKFKSIISKIFKKKNKIDKENKSN